MVSKKLISAILKAPLLILVISSFFASIYAAYNKISGVTYSVSIIFGIVILLYFIGVILNRKKDLY